MEFKKVTEFHNKKVHFTIFTTFWYFLFTTFNIFTTFVAYIFLIFDTNKPKNC